MYLYNITLIVEDASAASFLNWIKSVYVPQVIETGLYASNKLLTVVDSPNEGVTFCAQFVAETRDKHNQFTDIYEPILNADLDSKYRNKYVSYRTLMEII